MTRESEGRSRLPGPPLLFVVTIVVLGLAALLLATTQALWLRWVAMMAVAWWLPGALLVAHWRLPDQDLPTAGVLATGLGLCWMVLVTLLVHWLPGPMELWLLVAVYGVGAMVMAVALFWRPPLALKPVPPSTWAWLAVLLLLACLLRLPGLGYHEFHIDEVEVLRRASWAIQGVEDILARHTKGPGEIAIAAVVYRGLGTVNEATARLPFALLSIASVWAIAILGRRLFSPAIGFWAGVLLAANGFALGLSRIVQYQPAILLLSVLAVLAAWEFAQRGAGRWLALATLFSTVGVVMHYEFVLLAPVLLALAWRGWQRTGDRRSVALMALSAGVAGAILVAATYVPIVLDPHFGRTQRHLGVRLGGFGAFNVPFFVEMGTFYNSIYFFAGLILLVVAGLILGWRTARGRTLMLALWFAPAFVLHLFIMQLPGTHFYLFMPSWSLLAALPLGAVTQAKALRPVLRWGILALVAVWLAVSAGYLYLIFFRQSPEYLANYEETRVPFYWAPYGRDVPQQPRFGFPIQEGWKALGTLAGWGCLEGTYASNDGSGHHRLWYLVGLEQVKFEESPDFVFVADHVQEPSLTYSEERLDGYLWAGEVLVRDDLRIDIWARQPLPVPNVSYQAEDFTGAFDRLVPVLEDPVDPPSQVQGLVLGEELALESAILERSTLAPGDVLYVLLEWQPKQPLARDYKVFLHVADEEGRVVAQWDGLPCMNLARSSQWPVGDSVRDRVVLALPESMPPGEYSVLAGLYDESTGERLGGQAVEIGTVRIR